MTTRQAQLIKQLTHNGRKTAALFESLADSQLQQQVYTTGPKWTVQHILAHFVSAERAFFQQINNLLAGESTIPRDFNIDDFNQREVSGLLAQYDRGALLAAFVQARQNTIALAQKITDDDLDLTGHHPWFGEMSLEKMFKFVYRHNQIHQRDIRKALQSAQPVAHVEIAKPAA